MELVTYSQAFFANTKANNLSTKLDTNKYNFDITKGLAPVYTGRVEKVYTTGTWQYATTEITLPVGTYTCIINDINVSSVGYFSIAPNVLESIKYLDQKTRTGVYAFTVYEDETEYYQGNVFLKMQVSKTSNETAGTYFTDFKIYSGDITTGKLAYSSTLSNNGYIQIDVPSVKRNHTINFNSRVTSFTSIKISHEETFEYASAWIVIDDTNVVVKKGTTVIETVAHSLTIADFINVIIKVKNDATADLTIVTTGGVYTDNIAWNGCMGYIKATSISSELTYCTLTYYCADINKDIWAFGDSYFDMWPKYITDWGYTNIMFDGRSGRQSIEALASLNKCLAHRTPKMVLWCLGMNDADTTVVNANWKATYDDLLELCQEKNIELILATIPNTPTQNHVYKNAIVRASGKRYVDIDKAVGADISTAWYTGLLDADNVHPTTQGRKVIASKVITDIPEIM